MACSRTMKEPFVSENGCPTHLIHVSTVLAHCNRHFLLWPVPALLKPNATEATVSAVPGPVWSCVLPWLGWRMRGEMERLYVKPAPLRCRKVSCAWVPYVENYLPNSCALKGLKVYCQCLSSHFGYCLSIVMMSLPGLGSSSESRVHLTEPEEGQGSRLPALTQIQFFPFPRVLSFGTLRVKCRNLEQERAMLVPILTVALTVLVGLCMRAEVRGSVLPCNCLSFHCLRSLVNRCI